ncbi:agmatine deiminase family protein [Telmatospirillum sp. J64-1]|uniref:agmatine deiminase family protein n=1 Tax=Telmatospirillum sp. J64-1 TaxID=2502183 RepID=UPI00115DE1C2|nr:agmatine deiminase family protein [Telmatospirillum sp. J64-1]
MTPREKRYVLAPDWTPPGRFWMAWPPAGPDRSGDRLADARSAVADLARHVAEMGPVTMLANPSEAAEVSLRCGAGVGAMPVDHDACSMRLIGPGFLVDEEGRLAGGVDWGSGLVAGEVLGHLRLPSFPCQAELRPGILDVDGQGTCLVTEDVLAATGLGKEEAEEILAHSAGIECVLWLRGGLVGHTPDLGPTLGRFLAPGLVMLPMANGTGEEEHPVYTENLRRLRRAYDARGRRIEVVEVVQPKRRETAPDGTPLPLSYANCFVGDGIILLPAFEDGRDDMAYDAVVSAMMDHKVISFPVLDLIYGGGGLGAAILAQPKVAPS